MRIVPPRSLRSSTSNRLAIIGTSSSDRTASVGSFAIMNSGVGRWRGGYPSAARNSFIVVKTKSLNWKRFGPTYSLTISVASRFMARSIWAKQCSRFST